MLEKAFTSQGRLLWRKHSRDSIANVGKGVYFPGTLTLEEAFRDSIANVGKGVYFPWDAYFRVALTFKILN